MTKSPQFRFLLRALGSLAVALALWWTLLLDPLLGGLRVVTELALRLLPGDGTVAEASVDQDGNWLLRLPVPASVARQDSTQRVFGRVSKDAPLVKVRSLKLQILGKYPVLFTVSLPFFWALWVAAPGRKGFLRGLLIGTVLLVAAGVLSLIFYAIYTAVTTLNQTPSGMAGFLLTLGEYTVINVVPYAAPLLLALGLHKGLQGLVFSGEEVPPEPAHPAPKPVRAGRGRYR